MYVSKALRSQSNWAIVFLHHAAAATAAVVTMSHFFISGKLEIYFKTKVLFCRKCCNRQQQQQQKNRK